MKTDILLCPDLDRSRLPDGDGAQPESLELARAYASLKSHCRTTEI